MSTEKEERLGAAVGRIVSGCFVVTATHNGRSTGLLASWVQQASFDPLAVTVCVRKGRPIESLIQASGRFMVNVLSENGGALMRHFGRGFRLDEDAFIGLPIRSSEFGPVIQDTIAHLGCAVRSTLDGGDHIIYLGEVLDGAVERDERPYVHSRKTGLNY